MNTSQLEFQAEEAAQPRGKSQNETLRDYFLARPDRDIPMPVLARVITPTGIGAAVHSRVNDCRLKFGMNIHNKVLRKNGKSQSWYRYVPDLPAAQN
jgi:hypothetical protein